MPRHINPRCKRCDCVLSQHYAYEYCPACWQLKYHAPPGSNYFPPDKDAENPGRATPKLFHPTITTRGQFDSVLARHTSVLVA